MTVTFPHSRIAPFAHTGLPVRRGRVRTGWSGLLIVLLLANTGCKSKGGGGALTKTDPLISDQRIPPTTVPLPEPNGGLGNRDRRTDPLLGSPTGRDRTGSSRKDDVDRWKGPFVASQATSPAALASKLRNDHSDLAIGDKPSSSTPTNPDRGVKLQPASGTIPATPMSLPTNLGLIPQVLQDDLKALGIQRGDYEMAKSPEGEYAIRARVSNANGTTTRYEEVGPSAASAVQRLIDQLKSDRPR